MRQRSTLLLSILLIFALVVTVGACKKKQDAETVPDVPAVEPAPPTPPPPPTRTPPPDFEGEKFKQPELTRDEQIADWNQKQVLETIYFGFDSSELSETARRTLQTNADWLGAQPEASIVVEGHCDERGTIEYNLALGQRRADSVRAYMTNLGVGRDRMRIITYGEERPVDRGHAESAWSKNRRAQFLIER
jgi:peptidoglycan-associated lipoprotein